MASSSDPEKDSNKSQSKSENPFIRFRQFADQQISSLLQGIIGLPSAFSGKPSENPRWAVFDEDLRRRDELQARQQELRESEARRLGNKTTSEEVDIPVKKSPDWGASSRCHEHDPTTSQDNNGMRDLPLYSPVTRSLFAHLLQPAGGNIDWKQMELNSDLWALIQLPRLRRDQQSSDCLKMTQYMVYNQLNSSPRLHSDYSLLPYLMFSPYSPLRLTQSKSISPRTRAQDTFPYYDAFEDLIRTTQPPQVQTPFSQLFGHAPPLHRFLDGYMNIDPTLKASINYGWIQHLHQSGLLQESELRPFPRFPSIPFPVSPDTPPESRTSDSKLVSKEARTEQDMYEHFLRWASGPAVTETVESFLAAKAAFAKQFQSGDFPELPRALDELMETKFVKELMGELDADKQGQAQAQRKPDSENSVEDPDKVISEHTVTERVKQVDGSVQTYVSVWKMFADGRETTTTTSHTEEQERDEDGNLKPLVLPLAGESNNLAEKRNAEKENKVKKTEKKGWFWN
jgi:hypothetical protein